MASDWKSVIATVAPGIATALGGPLAGVAVGAISKALGLSESTEQAVQQAIAGATPDDLLKIKNADQAFALEMEKLGIEWKRIEAGDRASARQREAAIQDHTPKVIAFVVIVVWGVIQYHLFTSSIAPDMRELVIRVLGTLDGALMLILAYYFGASSQPTNTTIIGSERRR